VNTNPFSADHHQIRALIERQFQSLSWSKGGEGEWRAFEDYFLEGAPLFPGARPVVPTMAPDFVNRMQSLSRTSLAQLDESCLGAKISVFGNIADAMTVCELTENETITSHNIEALLLVKTGGERKIAAQAWDSAPQGSELPEEFLD
jgi:hypothetical protein